MTMKPKRAVITIATGKQVYINMAITLARSFLVWNKSSDIRFFIATDSDQEFPKDLDSISIMRFQPGELGIGFSMKLKLDQLAPSEQTLFIDADCLCVGPLDTVFDRFAGHAVSVVGGSISKGEWFGDVEKLCQHFEVAQIPKFNGGVYYIEPGETSSAIYSRARELENDYDQLGLIRLRGCPNEEMLMAISMALHGATAVPDDGTIHGDLFACPEIKALDVYKGVARLNNPPSDSPSHRINYPVVTINPTVVHFLGDFTLKWPYKTQEKILQLVSGKQWPLGLAKVWVYLTYRYPATFSEFLRNIFRPIYHRLFGVRAVRKSERLPF
jgi:hypothetical protein